MLRLNFEIHNPWYKENFKSLFSRHGKITKNKSWEFEISRYALEFFTFELELSWSGHDHAGPRFSFGLFGYIFYIMIHDNRHWDYKNKRWETYEDTNSEASN